MCKRSHVKYKTATKLIRFCFKTHIFYKFSSIVHTKTTDPANKNGGFRNVFKIGAFCKRVVLKALRI